MRNASASADLTLADLPDDLREVGVQLRSRYHALAADAELLDVAGAMEMAKLQDIEVVKRMDLGTLRALADTAEKLTLLGAMAMYGRLQHAFRVHCSLEEFRSPAFIAEAATHGFSRFQWAQVRPIVVTSPDGIYPSFVADGPLCLTVDYIPLDRLNSALPADLTVTGSVEIRRNNVLAALPPGLSVAGKLEMHDCTALMTVPGDLYVGGNIFFTGCTVLTTLPDGFTARGDLYLTRCSGLYDLPDDLTVEGDLDLTGCPSTVKAKGRHLKKQGRIKGELIIN